MPLLGLDLESGHPLANLSLPVMYDLMYYPG
jgi:hypothetical protein